MVGNIFGSSSRIAASLNTTDFKAFYDKIDRAIAAPCDIGLVSNYDERDYTKISKPDLAKQLPQIIHSEFDSTPYITSGVVLVRHPESGRHHLCFVRLSLQEGNRFLFNPRTFRIKEIADKTLGAGKPLDIVVLIGAPTEVILSGGLSIPDEVDELAYIQALGGDSFKFLDLDLPVPAGTEMVLIGTVHPENQPEGPFGDMRGFYITNPNPVCHVSEMWRRRGDIYHTVLGGMSHEHIGLVSLKPRHALEHVKSRFPGVKDYQLPQYAAGQLGILRVREDVAKNELTEALFDVGLAELFILVNEDTDIENPQEVLWALTQRTNDSSDYNFHDTNPTRARIFGEWNGDDKPLRQLVAKHDAKGLLPEKGTEPNVLYIS